MTARASDSAYRQTFSARYEFLHVSVHRSRLAATLDDLQRLGVEFRRALDGFGDRERSVWTRLVGDELTRPFYQRLRSDLPGFSTHQLREFAENSPGGGSNSATSDWLRNYGVDDGSPGGVVSQLSSVEGRYALLNADVPSMDISSVSDHAARELSHYADAVDVDVAVKVKVEDLLTKFDNLTSSVESLRSDCAPQSDDDLQDLLRSVKPNAHRRRDATSPRRRRCEHNSQLADGNSRLPTDSVDNLLTQHSSLTIAEF